MYAGDDDPDDQSLFMIEKIAFQNLCEGLLQPCGCTSMRGSWKLSSFVKKGHVARVSFECPSCKQSRVWASSRVLAGHYLANQKLVHAFTCAGMLPRQYMNFCKFAGMGEVKDRYISSVYDKLHYRSVIEKAAEHSMQQAIAVVKSNPDYHTKGEWVMTDARHDSTANAYHTTVPCLAGSTRRVVGVCTMSRPEHTTAQTREVECTRRVLPQVLARGLNITEVAHDNQVQVKKYIEELKMVNSIQK